MHVKIDTVITNFQGQPIHLPDGTPATFAHVAIDALMTPLPSDPRDDGAFQYACYTLAKKLSAHKSFQSFKVDEIVLIKKRVGNAPQFNHLVVGRVFDIIDNSGDTLAAVEG